MTQRYDCCCSAPNEGTAEARSDARAGPFAGIALRASVEEYSLKALEEFHRFKRRVPLKEARCAMREMEHALELGRPGKVGEFLKEKIALYNADDCFSTRSLRDWLEHQRRALEQAGLRIARPPTPDGAPPETVDERQRKSAALAERLTRGVSVDPAQRGEEDAARWLLANLLDWHRRESKANWWEYFPFERHDGRRPPG